MGLEFQRFQPQPGLELHKILLTSVRGQTKAPGSFRRFQNHIGRPGSSIDQAEFVPPAPEVLKESLSNWEKYYHTKEKDPLVQLALIHAQFEFLHPFLDGNGRIGRILIPLFLFDKEILSSPSFYLSEYLDENRESYIDHLRLLGIDKDAWTRWCLFFLKGLTVQADRNIERVKAILALYQRLKLDMLEKKNSRSTVPLLDAMFAQPIFQVNALLNKQGVPKRVQLTLLLNRLVDERILKVISKASGRRSAVYSLHELVTLCDSKPGAKAVKRTSGVTVAHSQTASNRKRR